MQDKLFAAQTAFKVTAARFLFSLLKAFFACLPAFQTSTYEKWSRETRGRCCKFEQSNFCPLSVEVPNNNWEIAVKKMKGKQPG